MTQTRQAHTTDDDYAALMVRLNAIPVIETTRRELTRQQERARLVEDLMTECGEAVL